MTGYGKGTFTYEGAVYLIEVHSVNRKHLDVSVIFPKELLPLDIAVRKWIASKIKRGQVTCRLSRDLSGDVKPEQVFDFNAAKATKMSLEKLAEEVGFSKDAITCSIVLDQMEKFPKSRTKDLDVFKKCLKEGLDQALEKILEMKHTEGSELMKDIQMHLANVKKLLPSIQSELSNNPKAYESRLMQKLEDYKIADIESKEKLLREVVLYADKVDIAEELSRIEAHLKHIDEVLNSDESSIGKTLDFIVQELHREANTIASKSQNLNITQSALTIKSSIEKAREQVQNVE
ncbi:MAG: hypothetical protein S4CHLAM37_11200 [Chlamydiia bacterium]|nr:hypothetical protein [Chlamydiia bacterium]